MIEGSPAVAALKRAGATHAVWLPDSELGTWEPALTGPDSLPLVRVCREGEAMAVAAGLMLGGAHPVVIVQCTGLFEAGDALRNVVHDLRLPLFLIVGVRSWHAHQAGRSADSCPLYASRFIECWRIPFDFIEGADAAKLEEAYRTSRAQRTAHAVLLAE